MDAGDLATWVGSCFAAVAAAATLWTLKSQRDQITEQRHFIGEQSATMALERAELRAAAEDRKWSQARQVAMEQSKAGGSPDGYGGLNGDHDRWDVTVQNGSDAPLHQLQVRFGDSYTATDAWEWPHYDHYVRGASAHGDRLALPVFLLGPGRAVRMESQRLTPATVHNNRPMLFFTDDNGVRWSLDSHGKLEEQPPDDAA
ncbi:hypothetical protein [Streptomyces sediminimaris]|uniref:hypothetical protein n=1 Tax=Streptomyces sediminimaris TaxID=3383721 RepID=UPI00399A85B5